MAKKKTKKQIAFENKLIKTGEPLYPVYISSDNHLSIVKGNKKLGSDIYHYDTIPGDSTIKRKDGLILTNVPGTCHGCCEECGKYKEDGSTPDCYVFNYIIHHHNSCVEKYATNTLIVRHQLDKFERELNDSISEHFRAVYRPHVSGEFDSKDEFYITLDAAKSHPDCQIYVYSKRVSWINEYLDNHKLPDNYVINLSPFNSKVDNPHNLPEFILDDGTDPEIAKLPHCPATDKNGNETGWTCTMCMARLGDFSCPFSKPGSKKAVYKH